MAKANEDLFLGWYPVVGRSMSCSIQKSMVIGGAT